MVVVIRLTYEKKTVQTALQVDRKIKGWNQKIIDNGCKVRQSEAVEEH